MLLMAAMCVLGFTSCIDDDDIGDNPDTPSEELADYTILFTDVAEAILTSTSSSTCNRLTEWATTRK